MIGFHTLINQSFNLIDTSFPMQLSIFILVILITVFWNRFTSSAKKNRSLSAEFKVNTNNKSLEHN